ncbi:hypothetical protein E2C01_026925 [Portunus trituberculatus]|uniref:Uncharacterized protein n=1 Tax=Portunus trituberculatus TaxID=210409 RepID=A0A5B7EGL1_PORTR|nr:hypothetical protein [Portunus trituberculatus]
MVLRRWVRNNQSDKSFPSGGSGEGRVLLPMMCVRGGLSAAIPVIIRGLLVAGDRGCETQSVLVPRIPLFMSKPDAIPGCGPWR